MNIVVSREAQIAQWQTSLALLSDAELIIKVNREVGICAWTSSRADYLSLLHKEIRKRSFISSILFDFDSNGTVISFKLKNKVQLINQALEFIS
jgi:5S rRNA maturation endonuclease (ribonuclease M5)